MSAPRHARCTNVSRTVAAPREIIYRAFLDPAALAWWLPPGTMTGQVHSFEPGEGGGYRMSLTYQDKHNRPAGKTSADTDTFSVRFVELVPDTRIVQRIRFEGSDPALVNEMVMTITFAEAAGETRVTIQHDDIPAVIRIEDNEAGVRQSLDQLAAFIDTR